MAMSEPWIEGKKRGGGGAMSEKDWTAAVEKAIGLVSADEKLLVLMPFGSHLYGTQTKDSDTDIKGVFLPSVHDALTGKIEKRKTFKTKASGDEKNGPEDFDIEILSLHEFLRLAVEGQTMALDMLHADPGILMVSTKAWAKLIENKSRFYTKNLSAFVGYARRQAAKYGIKGSRLACGRVWLALLKKFEWMTVAELLESIASDIGRSLSIDAERWEHARLTGDQDAPLEILGRRLTAGAKCSHYVPTFEKYVSEYGARALDAEQNKGIDWKAMSHAMRAAIMVEAILSGLEVSLPFEPSTAGYLLDIKSGRMTFRAVQDRLERLMDEIDVLAEKSGLPEKADAEWADGFLCDAMMAAARAEVAR